MGNWKGVAVGFTFLAWIGCGPIRGQDRPLPGLAIDGVDADRPWPAVVHLPSHGSVFGMFGRVSGEMQGVVESALEEGTWVGAGVQGRIGRSGAEVLALGVETLLEGAFVSEGQAFAAGSEVSQQQLVVRGFRELFRWEGFFGLTKVDFGLRVSRVTQQVANSMTALTVESESMIPGMELVFDNRKIVGGEFGIHSRTALVMGQGNGARERTVDWKFFFNYPLSGGTFQRTDVAFGYRYMAQELTFYSVLGNRSTKSSFGLGGPELTVSVRF